MLLAAGTKVGSLQGLYSYLPLHLSLETLAVMAAMYVFAIVWSTRQQKLPCNLVIIAVSAFAAGILDFSHMLSYQGMPDFVTPSDPEKAINFWLAARLFTALGLLAAAFVPWRIPLKNRCSWPMIGLMLAVTAGLHVLFLWYPHWLPRTYISGSGLTGFKVAFEYVLIGLLLVASLRYLFYLRQQRQFNASGFFAAAMLMAQAEFFFTLYVEVNDIYNLAGHVYKVLGYVFLYRAVFVETVKRPYELLNESRARLDATLGALPDLLFEMDEHGHYLQVYATDNERLITTASGLPGKSVFEVLPVPAAKTVLLALNEARSNGISRGSIIQLQMPDGDTARFELSVSPYMHSHNHAKPSYLVIAHDVTARHAAEKSLRTLSQAVEQNPLAILILDKDFHIQQANPAFSDTSGYRLDEVVNRHPGFLHDSSNPPCLLADIERCLSAGKSWKGEVNCLHKSGREYVVLMRLFPVRDADGQVCNYLVIKDDISANKKFAARLEQISNHDQLTGLPNRNLLQQQFDREIASNKSLSLLWLDLDNIKDVNDALGYASGDMLLKQVSYRLRDCLQRREVLARISGDDFVILLPGSEQGRVALRTQQFLESLAEPFILPGQTLSVTASVGIAVFPQDAGQLPDLLQKAEISKYKAKEAGRNNYQFYEARMQEKAALRLAQGNALKMAIERNELFLLYQPQISMVGGRMVGVEALLRWQSAEWGLVSPVDFIPMAESNGMILPIGEWVLKTALRQLSDWLACGVQPFGMAVNISAIQFERPGLIGQIKSCLEQTQVPANLLDLELTEAVAMKNPELSEQRIKQLHELGVRLSIDDFGTGYSSLSYLKRFKIDKLKIDREFIREMDSDSDDQAITTAVIQMAQQLTITTLAEGVETRRQLDLLRQYGCDQVQGFYFSKPLTPEQLLSFVSQRNADV